jgi:hypothetical protein
LRTLRGLLSDERRLTLVEDPTLPDTVCGISPMPWLFMPPDITLRFELTAEVRVPILLEVPMV